MKRGTRVLVVLVLLTAITPTADVWAQAGGRAAASAAPNSNGCAVAGTVVRADNGAPLKMAQVLLIGTDSVSENGAANRPLVETDQEGRFEITNLAPGSYRLMVVRGGFINRQGRRAQRTLTLGVGQQLRDLLVRLQPGAAITGQVLDEDSEPLAGAVVQVLSHAYESGRRQLSSVGNGFSNDLGEYRVYGLPPGNYLMLVNANWPGARSPGSKTRYPPTFYPGTASASQATTVALRAGDEIRVNFSLVPVRTFKVRGRILGSRSKDPSSVGLVLLSREGSPDLPGSESTMQAQNGSFELSGVLPGAYDLVALGEGDVGGRSFATLPVNVDGADLEGLELQLQPMRTWQVHGVVRLRGPGNPNLDALRVTLQPTRATEADSQEGALTQMGISRGGSAEVDKNGTFSVPTSNAGTYQTWITTSDPALRDYYTEAVLYGGREVTQTGISLSGASPGRLEIVIRSDGARIEGTVIDAHDKPSADADVVVAPEARFRNRFEDYQTATSDQNGHFVIRGLRPGEYTVYAFEELDGDPYLDPDFLHLYEQQSKVVHAEAGRATDVTVKAVPSQAEETKQ